MNTLLEGPSRMGYYTNLSWIFRAIGERQNEFNWLLTDLECIGFPFEPACNETYAQQHVLWFSGEELTQIVDLNHIQFVWGVLSGFRPGVKLDIRVVPE